MVLAKSKNAVGLGNSLMNDRFGKGKGADMRRGNFQSGIQRTGQNGETVRRPSSLSLFLFFFLFFFFFFLLDICEGGGGNYFLPLC